MLQVALNGLFLGGTYALLAAGLSLAFGIMGVLNLAHGSIAVFAAILYRWALAHHPFSPWTFALLASPLFVGVGVLLHLILVAPFDRLGHAAKVVVCLIASLGLALVLEDMFVWWQGWEPVAVPYSLATVRLFGVAVPGLKAAVLGFDILCLGAALMFLAHTDKGLSMQALAQDRSAAMLFGVPPGKTSAAALGLASLLAGVAGVFYSTVYPLGPRDGLMITLKALFIVVAGGMGTLAGPVVSGFVLGLVEAAAGFVFPPSLTETLVYGLLVGYLFLRRGWL